MTGIDSWMRAHGRGGPRVLSLRRYGYCRGGIGDPIDCAGKAVVVGGHFGCHSGGVLRPL